MNNAKTTSLGGTTSNNKSSTPKGLIFPTRTAALEQEPYICITAAYENEDSKKGDKRYKALAPALEIKGSVVLPMPNQIQDAQEHMWSTYSITDSVQEFAGEVGSALGGVASKIAGAASTVGGLVASNGLISKLSRRTTGVGIDPNTRLEYTGEGLREFTFNFTLLPESAADATAIKNIIKFFRVFGTGIKSQTSGDMTASVSEGLQAIGVNNINAFIKEPHVFIINFANPHINDMLMPIDCVLVNFSTSFFEDGYAAFFKDGMPKKVSISMTFKERYTLYAQDWLKTSSGVSVGKTDKI
jgi:hypothetical protein